MWRIEIVKLILAYLSKEFRSIYLQLLYYNPQKEETRKFSSNILQGMEFFRLSPNIYSDYFWKALLLRCQQEILYLQSQSRSIAGLLCSTYYNVKSIWHVHIQRSLQFSYLQKPFTDQETPSPKAPQVITTSNRNVWYKEKDYRGICSLQP